MHIKIVLLLLLLVVRVSGFTSTRGAVLVGPFINTDLEGMLITGGITLQAGGAGNVFAATGWSFTGGLHLSMPGNYTLHGQAGFTGGISGPPSGFATIRFTGGAGFTGDLAPNVRILEPSEEPPLEVPPQPVFPTLGIAPPWPGLAVAAPLGNVSLRVTLGTGQTATLGFVVGGRIGRRVLIRAVGPGLSALGIQNPMPNPMLTLWRGTVLVANNDDWGGGPDTQFMFAAIGAFPLPVASRDAAILLKLEPGNYTVQARGATATDAGEVVMEVYYVD